MSDINGMNEKRIPEDDPIFDGLKDVPESMSQDEVIIEEDESKTDGVFVPEYPGDKGKDPISQDMCSPLSTPDSPFTPVRLDYDSDLSETENHERSRERRYKDLLEFELHGI